MNRDGLPMRDAALYSNCRTSAASAAVPRTATSPAANFRLNWLFWSVPRKVISLGGLYDQALASALALLELLNLFGFYGNHRLMSISTEFDVLHVERFLGSVAAARRFAVIINSGRDDRVSLNPACGAVTQLLDSPFSA